MIKHITRRDGSWWLKLAIRFIVYSFLSYTSTAFSSFTSTGRNDVNAVQAQLGYLPSNYLYVSAWKENGDEPVAIKTYPLHGGAKRRQAKAVVNSRVSSPFPTLYWLTCPEISRAVADFERRGYIKIIEEEVKSDPCLAHRLIACHKEYANERWNSLTEEDRSLLSVEDQSKQRMRNMMEFSGISGTNFTVHDSDDGKPFVAPIKCLHAHYAHYRSTMVSRCTQNPVGEIIHRELAKEFPNLEL